MVRRSPGTVLRLRQEQGTWESARFWLSVARREVGYQALVWAALLMFLLWGMLGLVFVPIL